MEDKKVNPLEVIRGKMQPLILDQRKLRRELHLPEIKSNIESVANRAIARGTNRLYLRIYHLASCFLRCTPYKRVEPKVSEENLLRPTRGILYELYRELDRAGYPTQKGELERWIGGQDGIQS